MRFVVLTKVDVASIRFEGRRIVAHQSYLSEWVR